MNSELERKWRYHNRFHETLKEEARLSSNATLGRLQLLLLVHSHEHMPHWVSNLQAIITKKKEGISYTAGYNTRDTFSYFNNKKKILFF